MSKNGNLVFVKMHAPHSIILALAKHYGTRKYFRDNHVELMEETIQDERDFIKAIRFVYCYI